MPAAGKPIGYSTKIIRVTPVIDTAAYTAKDAVGAVFALTDIVAPGAGGMIVGLTVIDIDDQKAALELFLFDTLLVGTANNAAFPTTSPTEAIIASTCIGRIAIPAASYVSATAIAVAEVACNVLVRPPSDLTTIYGQLMTSGTPTYTAVNSLVLAVKVQQF
jgi:hypothetical protein